MPWLRRKARQKVCFTMMETNGATWAVSSSGVIVRSWWSADRSGFVGVDYSRFIVSAEGEVR